MITDLAEVETWASMCIKLTRNKMIALVKTPILKATGNSENRRAKWIENRNDDECLKRGAPLSLPYPK